ncbi:Na-translocating system protein MpsC family protein [Hyella patelloides]|uniref:Na-translocating system protein MpsC family protein n=1 Tax=Hyella patelloides TaxID=1982969 RepID=UPI0011AA7EEB|nr:Na-translocating system protein MpsC family protein [Hyella patelloides]
MDKNLPTSGQLERNLSQDRQKLYRQKLKHFPRKVTCQPFGNQLAILIEDALTLINRSLSEKRPNKAHTS